MAAKAPVSPQVNPQVSPASGFTISSFLFCLAP